MPVLENFIKAQPPFKPKDKLFYEDKMHLVEETKDTIEKIIPDCSQLEPSQEYVGVYSHRYEEGNTQMIGWLSFFKFNFIIPINPSLDEPNTVVFLGSFNTKDEAAFACNAAVNFINKKLSRDAARILSWNINDAAIKCPNNNKLKYIKSNVCMIMQHVLPLFLIQEQQAKKNIAQQFFNFPFTARDITIDKKILNNAVRKFKKYAPLEPSKRYCGVYSILRNSQQAWIPCLQIKIGNLGLEPEAKLVILFGWVETEQQAAYAYDIALQEAINYIREKRLATSLDIGFNACIGLLSPSKDNELRIKVKRTLYAALDLIQSKNADKLTNTAAEAASAHTETAGPTILPQFKQLTDAAIDELFSGYGTNEDALVNALDELVNDPFTYEDTAYVERQFATDLHVEFEEEEEYVPRKKGRQTL